MNITNKQYHPDVGLKYNKEVVLGKDDVTSFIEQHKDLFENLDVDQIDGSTMLYGYTATKHPIKIGLKDDLIQRIIVVTNLKEYTRFKAIISYDGHQYNGFQIQKNQPTIQGELTRVISSINGYDTLVQGCSRTDTGVHANHYVIHFDSTRDIDEKRWFELLNYQLEKDILVKQVSVTHPLFHSRYDVIKKRYIYKIKLNQRNPFKVNYQWNKIGWDFDRLSKNISQLMGTHDFASFCKGSPDSTIRTIFKAEALKQDDELLLVFEGDGFLRYMIRIIVYALYLISSNQLEMTIHEIIQEKSRKHTKHLAPANGLYLDQIYY